MTAVKICGLRTLGAIDAAAGAGAAFVGFVFYPPSPRSLSPAAAAALAPQVPHGVVRTGLFVDPDDALLAAVLGAVPLDLLQLHGHESPARVAAIRAQTGLPAMKAVGVAGPDDLAGIAVWEEVADRILIDAKPPRGAVLPGGNGLAFDWRIVAGRRWRRPWMLAGGLTPLNVAEAIRLTGAPAVDVSSGVESAPGVKDAHLIRAFLAASA
jgi:phosphoribosylanthranilate isomerase